jgi:serine protease Do
VVAIVTWRALRGCLVTILAITCSSFAQADLADTIARVKPSVVVVGTYEKLRSPAFEMRGTGFAVGDGSLVATNAHVINPSESTEIRHDFALLVRGGEETKIREARLVISDPDHDLAILRITGSSLTPLQLSTGEQVREGQSIAFMGFPIGGALGFSPVTHRGIISSITPIALPGGNADQLRGTSIRRLRGGTFPIYQLDATAYPGNSGGPMFDTESGTVIGVLNMVFVKGGKEAVLEKPSGISYSIPATHLRDLLGRIESR